MGFDTFTSKEFMNVLQTTENGWAKDEILTHHIMEAMDTTKQEDCIYCQCTGTWKLSGDTGDRESEDQG